MIGFSIQAPVFLGRPSKDSKNDLIAHYDRVELFLDLLKGNGVQSIEVRILPRGVDAAAYQELMQIIWSMGFSMTIHGHVEGEHTGSRFADIYPSMSYVLSNYHKYQDSLTMAIHAFDAKTGSEQELHRNTVNILQSWSSMVDAEGIPLRFALENNRKKSSKVDPGDSINGVLRMVEEIDRPNVGITWDMGHFYSNLLDEHGLKSAPETLLNDLPPVAFLERVYHTHIHGIGETNTHNPLADAKSLPLELYISALQAAGFNNVYNLELTMNKFNKERSLSEYVEASIQRLHKSTTCAPNISF